MGSHVTGAVAIATPSTTGFATPLRNSLEISLTAGCMRVLLGRALFAVVFSILLCCLENRISIENDSILIKKSLVPSTGAEGWYQMTPDHMFLCPM